MLQPDFFDARSSFRAYLLAVLVSCSLSQSTIVLAQSPAACSSDKNAGEAARKLFARDNLIAWCIVPFDSKKRAPEDRAAMLQKLGFKHFAYDWRGEHIPTFDAEVEASKRHGVALDAFWVAPGELNRESRIILDLLKRHGIKAQLWVLLDFGRRQGAGRRTRAPGRGGRGQAAAACRRGRARSAARSHFITTAAGSASRKTRSRSSSGSKARGVTNIGMVYNLHHGHDHLDRFPRLLAKTMPYLVAVNLNGMDPGGDRHGRKILPLGQGSRDLELLRIDRGQRLSRADRHPWPHHGRRGGAAQGQSRRPRLAGAAARRTSRRAATSTRARPCLRRRPAAESRGRRRPAPLRVPPRHPMTQPWSPRSSMTLASTAIRSRGAGVFASPKFACLSCHRVGDQGAMIGPDLSTTGTCLKPEEVVESLLWPRRQVKEAYAAYTVATSDGKIRQGYKVAETPTEMVFRDPGSADRFQVARSDIEEIRQDGTLMPDGLTAAMSPAERRDLVRFLFDLGRTGSTAADSLRRHSHTMAEFVYDRAPLHPERWPNWQHPVNRDRIYEFYAKEAAHFSKQPSVPSLLPPFPGLDGGKQGHWGNQNEDDLGRRPLEPDRPGHRA